MNYAGFWKRLTSFIIDTFITMVGGFIIGFILGMVMFSYGIIDNEVMEGIGSILGIIIGWIYFSAMESSPTQGTIGKMVLGIKVTDLEGNRISFGRATGRHFGKIISTIILGIGYIMVAFTEKKQGLHDKMAECLVVDK